MVGLTYIGQRKCEIEPFAFSERNTDIKVLFGRAYYRIRGDMLLAPFLEDAKYREAEECENNKEA